MISIMYFDFPCCLSLQGLIDVIIEDNLKQELTSAYRSDLEDELGNKDDKYVSFDGSLKFFKLMQFKF